MRDWLNRLIFGPEAPPPLAPPAETRVCAGPHRIEFIVRGTPAIAIDWSDLTAVSILTPDASQDRDEFVWLLQDRDHRRVLQVPMSTAGEHDLLLTMQARLEGFDNMAVVEALSASANGGACAYTVWDEDWTEQ